eukprot:TRINITY_DN5539_c0_g1_i14.p1 TRINITY_DN5539_c0_g1~~TRINITY_DN5539_c0_g1_i14.p1  ORF type:complete len:323 (+),score=60.87 TRINITY_DN5539_c0_g1_i14:147-1115(+)
MIVRFGQKEEGTDLYFPSLLSLYLSNGNLGTVEMWDICLDGEVTTVGPWNPLYSRETEDPIRCNLVARVFGHNHQIISIVSHYSLPLVASLDDSGKLIIWHVMDTTFSDSHHILVDINLNFDEVSVKGLHLAWDMQHPVLYVKDVHGLWALTVPDVDVDGDTLPDEVPVHLLSSNVDLDEMIVVPSLHFYSNLAYEDLSATYILGREKVNESDDKKLILWKVNKSPLGWSSVEILSETLHDILCLCSPRSVMLDDSSLSLGINKYCNFLTGSKTGEVCAWRLCRSQSLEKEGNDDKVSWNLSKLCHFFVKSATIGGSLSFSV